jgi:hypothetical protein
MRYLECGSQAVTERPGRHRPVLSANGGRVHHPTIKQAGESPTLAYQAILEFADFWVGQNRILGPSALGTALTLPSPSRSIFILHFPPVRTHDPLSLLGRRLVVHEVRVQWSAVHQTEGCRRKLSYRSPDLEDAQCQRVGDRARQDSQ